MAKLIKSWINRNSSYRETAKLSGVDSLHNHLGREGSLERRP